VATDSIEAYLTSKGLALKQAGNNNVHTACVFCGEDQGKRGRLYINIDPTAEPPGLFFCHLCGVRGAMNKLRKHFGDPVVRDDDPNAKEAEASYRTHDVLQAAAAYYHELLSERDDVLRWLRDERGLSIETIIKHQIGWADGSLRQHLLTKDFTITEMMKTGLVDQNGRDFLLAHVTIPYHAAGNVVLIRGKEMGGKYRTPPGQKGRLFNPDVTWGAEQIVVTEGEFDALVLEQLGYAAVGVPGATSWQDSWNGYFTEAKKVYVCFDNDAPGMAGAEKVARAIGPSSRIVRMPEALPGESKNDPSEWIVKKGHGKDDFQLLLVKSRGGHLLSVHDAYAEWLDVKSLTGIQLGYEMIDKKLEPGLLPTQVMIVLAKTGAGKTIWTLNTFHRMVLAKPDVRILFVSLEQTRSEWFERARRIYRFYNLAARDTDVLGFFEDRLMLIDKNRVSEEELVGCIEQYEFELGHKPDLVAIDYLGYWSRAYKGEPYERTSKAVMALKAIAKEHRIAILAPHQVSRVVKFGEGMEADAGRDSGVVEETADFLLTLWAEDSRAGKTPEEKSGIVNLKIGKSRHGGTGTQCQLQFAPLSLAMIPVGDVLHSQARAELEHSSVGDGFEESLYRHLMKYPGSVRLPKGWREELEGAQQK
jgi:archaellum biogenesis ATPase FlaH